MLVVGLGGGSLPLFVHDYFPQACVAVVEIDPSMLEVATHWFGFSQDDRMQVHIADGLDHVAKLAAEGTVLQSFNSISCPALLLVSNSASCLSLCYPVPPQQPRCGMVFPMFLQHLMPCVTSSNLDRSLQQADLSLSVCVQWTFYLLSVPSPEGAVRRSSWKWQRGEPGHYVRCFPTQCGSSLCHGIMSPCSFLQPQLSMMPSCLMWTVKTSHWE